AGDADPGEERRAALLARLRADDAFRKAFLDEIRLLGMLRVVQSSEPRWLRLEDELGWSGREPASADSLADRVVRSLTDQVRRRALARRVPALAAAVLALVGVIALFSPTKAPDGPPEARPDHGLELATAVKVDDVRWESGDGLRPREGGAVTAGRL